MTVWADEDQSQGDFHTNFKLSKSGEFIGIFDAEENYFAPIDTFSFATCATNKTYGRYPDGVGVVKTLDNVTKGKSNVITFTQEQQHNKVFVYPNPALDYLQIASPDQVTKLVIYNASGQVIQIVQSMPLDGKINVSQWPSGFYIAHLFGKSSYLFHFMKL
ncbi:MAG: T9SS type A sorting domain-containing protein [Saprospiraceae bacterium]|nr:T9SS type A sorting domain-containing protein [Saprospiraceae bacterium]